jgi:hypothetical protein
MVPSFPIRSTQSTTSGHRPSKLVLTTPRLNSSATVVPTARVTTTATLSTAPRTVLTTGDRVDPLRLCQVHGLASNSTSTRTRRRSRCTAALVKMVCKIIIANDSMTNCHTGTLPIKSTQGVQGREAFVQKNGCVVMEVQDWIDAINQPEWQRESRQIFGPNSPTYTLEADYVFSTKG